MSTPEERAAIQTRARRRAEEMGYRQPADPDVDQVDQAPAVQLPTTRPGALRALLNRGHLTSEQAALTRRLFAEAARIAREDPTA